MPAPARFNDKPFPYHHELTLEVETLTNLGVGLGRVDGWVVMVPFALPGESVRARVFRNHANYSQADLVEVLRSSPARRAPACPLFGDCGGCQYQHLEYAQQLAWKTRQVREVFARLGGLPEADIRPAHPSPREYHYRSKLTPHYERPRPDSSFPIGFLRAGRRVLVDVLQCPIATEAVNAALPATRAALAARAATLKRGGTLLLREVGAPGQTRVVTDPRATVTAAIGDTTFQFQAGDFFQNNPFILPELVDYVLAEAAGAGAKFLLDVYCGAGVFALCGRHRFTQCLGVEVNADAVLRAIENASRNDAANCVFRTGAAETIFAGVKFLAAETAVILDPPRAGCDEPFLRQLIAYAPARIVYVSCDPATQARDIKILAASGYRLLHAQPFDLFPQTRHIENVATMEKVSY
ncbi:MAG: class I SAM-dependent RNA methyltransferase [Opitutales bacterium]|jgi:23S rRNA (uracil1939-C5)-methyltransferase/tRNA (uracil-5-)-methyltransferase